MTLVPSLAVGSVALAAYLDAKYHISKDISVIHAIVSGKQQVKIAVAQDRLSLWPYFEEQVFKAPSQQLAIWSRGGEYSWRQTYDQSNRYSQLFLSLGVAKHDFVGCYMSNSPEFIFAWFGCLGIGAAPALINYNLARNALLHCLKLAGIRYLLVGWDEGCVDRIEASRAQIEALGIQIIILDKPTRHQIDTLKPDRPDDHFRQGLATRSPVALIYTSGSTGLPKAIPLTVDRIIPYAGRLEQFIGIKGGPNGDRFYCCMPLYHGTSGFIALNCIIGGVTLCIGKKFSVKAFWPDVRDSKATAFVYVGEAARYLLAQPPSPTDKDHNFRIMFGNGLRPEVWSRFQARFAVPQVAEFFNSSEGVFGLLNWCKGPYCRNSVGHHGLLVRKLGKFLFAVAEVDHDSGELVRDEKTGFANMVSPDIGGEVLVRCSNESVFGGYYRDPEATEAKFARNFFKDGDLWYRTGDTLRRSSDGHWTFLDRLGDTFRWKSENVATMEVANIVDQFEGIAETAVYGVTVPGHDGRAGCAAIWLGDQKIPTDDFLTQLLAHIKSNLPKYAVPIFLRLLVKVKPMHNQKQNKFPLKKDGINLDAVYGSGRDASDNFAGGQDLLYWWPEGLGVSGKGRYILLTRADWILIQKKAKEMQTISKL